MSENSEAAALVDLDGDGDLDVVVTGGEGNRNSNTFRVAWRENLDGHGTFGEQRIIHTSRDQFLNLNAADLDGDGDNDLFMTTRDAGRRRFTITTIKNLDGKGQFWEPDVAAEDTRLFSQWDVNGDGAIDLIAGGVRSESSQIWWYENQGNGEFGRRIPIASRLEGTESVENVAAGDVDQDGYVDLVVTGSRSSYVIERTARGFTRAETLHSRQFVSVDFADLNGDNRQDLVMTDREGLLLWMEQTDVGYSASVLRGAAEDGQGGSVVAVDMDRDGDLDIVSSHDTRTQVNTLSWYENSNGAGTFVEKEMIAGQTHGIESLHTGDIDSDGDVDLLTASSSADAVIWYENSNAERFISHRLGITHSHPEELILDDIDDDGDLDLFLASEGEFSWFERRADGFARQQVISTDVFGGYAIRTGDIDGDGWRDVITGDFGGTLAWHRNLDGRGAFGDARLIVSGLNGLESIEVGDIDNDGDLDVFAAARLDRSITWYENEDGVGNFGSRQLITDAVGRARDVAVADVDGDGDLDVLAASRGSVSVALFRNLDGAGNFGPLTVIAYTGQAERILFADMDEDGHLDLLVASSPGIQLFLNPNGAGEFADAIDLTGGEGAGLADYVDVADLDRDGDPDIVFTHRGQVSWSENLGDLRFALQYPIVSAAHSATSIVATDVDGDGATDLLFASNQSDQIVIQRNVGVPGDADENGVFDSSDLTLAFRGGEFEDSEDGNSVLAEGDFNGDGDFTTADLVFAFTYGRYVTG